MIGINTPRLADGTEQLGDVILQERRGKIKLVAKPDDVRIRIRWAKRGYEYLRMPADSGPTDAQRIITLYVDREGTLRIARIPDDIFLVVYEYSQIQRWFKTGEYKRSWVDSERGPDNGMPVAIRDAKGHPFIPWGHDSSSIGNFIW